MGMETLPELTNSPKKSDFKYQISSDYVSRVDSGFFESNFRFFGFGRVLLIPKHKAIIMKEKNNLYLERYNDKSDPVLLISMGQKGTSLSHSCST